jgi:hypothetical protein
VPTKSIISLPSNQGRKNNNADALSRRPPRKECVHCHKVEALADVKHIRGIAAVAAASWDPVALRWEQLNDKDIGTILEEEETGRRPERKDIADRSPTYKSYWNQWKSLAVRNGILERHCESTNRQPKIAQINLPRCRVNDMLTELHGGRSGCYLGVNKTLNKVRQRYYWFQAINDVEKWRQQCDTCATSRGPRTMDRRQMNQYNVGVNQ